jgi:hypothetical protein
MGLGPRKFGLLFNMATKVGSQGSHSCGGFPFLLCGLQGKTKIPSLLELWMYEERAFLIWGVFHSL